MKGPSISFQHLEHLLQEDNDKAMLDDNENDGSTDISFCSDDSSSCDDSSCSDDSVLHGIGYDLSMNESSHGDLLASMGAFIERSKEETNEADAKCGLNLSLDGVKFLRESSCGSKAASSASPTGSCRRVSIGSETSALAVQHIGSSLVVEANHEHPKTILKAILDKHTFTHIPFRSDDLSQFFVKQDKDGKYQELVRAVRDDDLEAIISMRKAGVNLQVSNRFGESILHVAAKLGRLNILKYLVKQAGISIRVCCDTGRNPLHDACWSSNPNFECVLYIFEECSDLLLTADKRGFTPLDYIPKDQYQTWGHFLESHSALLNEKLLMYLSLPNSMYFI